MFAIKRCICLALFLLLLSACSAPVSETTPTPKGTYTPDPSYTWWVNPTPTPDPTPSPEPTPTPEPSPEPTPFLSYEDYFSQEIDYGSIFDEENCYYDHVEWVRDPGPAVTLAQELVSDDSMSLIPKSLHYVADRCLYVFWAGNEEGVYLYRLYYPTETLDLIYTIPAEEFEEKYYYTPRTETTAYMLNCQVGERRCLIGGVAPCTNQLYQWGTFNLEFLALLDEMAAHKEDYPQYNWGRFPDEDLVPFVESDHAEEQLYLRIYCCINAATGEYREKTSSSYGEDQYEVQW